jgi:hypothetical protein
VPEMANVGAILLAAGGGGQSLMGDCSWTSREACCRVPMRCQAIFSMCRAPMAHPDFCGSSKDARCDPSGLNTRGSGRTRKFTTGRFAPVRPLSNLL